MSQTRTRPDGTRQSRGRDLVLAYALVVPFLVATGAAMGATPRVAFAAAGVAVLLAGSLLLFLAGAVRGSQEGALLPFALFAMGFGAIFGLVVGFGIVGPAFAAAGFLLALLFARRPLGTIRFGAPALLLLMGASLVLLLREAGLI